MTFASTPWRVRIFYPADPLGVVASGIDTFIRGVIRHAPPELEFSLVGMTTDAAARPVGRWRRHTLGDRSFDFFPAVSVADAAQRGRVPLSVRYTWAVARQRTLLAQGADAFEFHRLEPLALFLADARPKNAFFHQDPAVVAAAGSDILWRRLPGVYRRMEAILAPRLTSAWCVRDAGVRTLQRRYPTLASAVRFVPTWVDAHAFALAEPHRRAALRATSAATLGLDPSLPRIVSVGRLDTQKDPLLLLHAFAHLLASGVQAALLLVGDGVLRPALAQRVAELGIQAQVRFLGLLGAPQIAEVLRAADVYALSSAYEGMPMALLEALACGLPAACTDVGEVRRVVRPGVNGAIAEGRSVAAYADCLHEVLLRRADYAPHAAPAVRDYQPHDVLAPVYANYLAWKDAAPAVTVDRAASLSHAAANALSSSLSASLPAALSAPLSAAVPQSDRLVALVGAERRPVVLPPPPASYAGRVRASVIGVPIDALTPAQVCRQVMQWARARESRVVCFCNVHSVVHARQDLVHRAVIAQADLAAPDGAPIAWTLRWKRGAEQPRTSGPDVMLQLCAAAARQGVAIGLYGSSTPTLDKLRAALLRQFPGLRIAYVHAPPFRAETEAETAAVCAAIGAAGVGLLFVALGCPKQEAWMAERRGRIPAVMLGVGAAFDFHAGIAGRAPTWMRASGLEWLHRLVFNPRRLAKRYAVTNTLFVLRTAAELGAVRVGLPAVFTAAPSTRRHGSTSPTQSDMNSPLPPRLVDELVARIDVALPTNGGRVIEFIASGAGEGTTTLVTACARALSARARRVLLLSPQADPGDEDDTVDSIADVLRRGQAPAAAARPHADGYSTAALAAAGASASAMTDAAWAALRAAYDDILVDMPPTSASRAGLVIAPKCDGVVVIVEAEKSRAPVVEALVASLRAVHANVLGTVLNKRQLHVPAAIYRRL